MNKACWLILGSSLIVAATANGEDLRLQCEGTPRTQVETIDAARGAYMLHMGGKIDGEMTRDPMGYWAYDQYWEPNVSVRLENVGDTPVIHPWISVSGSRIRAACSPLSTDRAARHER